MLSMLHTDTACVMRDINHSRNSMRGLRHTMADLDPHAVKEIPLGKDGQEFRCAAAVCMSQSYCWTMRVCSCRADLFA